MVGMDEADHRDELIAMHDHANNANEHGHPTAAAIYDLGDMLASYLWEIIHTLRKGK